MYQFFVEPYQIQDKKIVIEGQDVNHIKNVLRMKVGEEVACIAAGEDKEYRGEIAEISEDQIVLTLLFVKEGNVELPVKVTLFQGLPKNDKMELIIQKAVELGVFEIVPLKTKRAVVKLDDKKEQAKVTRWNAIAEAAAKQSKRGLIPRVTKCMTMKEALSYCGEFETKLIPYELADMDGMKETRALLESIKPGQRAAVFIGPEGGFSEEEIELAMERDIHPMTLGHRILRTETAGFVVLSWLNYLLEE